MNALLELPLVGILRGLASSKLPGILRAVATGGLRNLEITMNSPGAVDQIRQACEISSLNIGAGTVTSLELLDKAMNAGARFIVTPTLNRPLVSECVRRQIPVVPGAFSPSEICDAWELGACLVKIFPADSGGPAFLRSVRAAFPQIRLMPTGGIDLRLADHFIAAGADGLGVGSPLFEKARIENDDWHWLQQQTTAFVNLFVR